jgi:hypothetical protein
LRQGYGFSREREREWEKKILFKWVVVSPMLHTTTWNTMGRTQWGLGFRVPQVPKPLFTLPPHELGKDTMEFRVPPGS